MFNDLEYTKFRVVIATKKNGKEYRMITYKQIPLTDINDYLVLRQGNSVSGGKNDVYHLYTFLQYLESLHIDYHSVTLDNIYNFYHILYNDQHMRYKTLRTYCNSVAGLYEYLATRNIKLDESLFRYDTRLALQLRKTKITGKRDHLTTVGPLFYLFQPRKELYVPMISYLKWYTGDEVKWISEQLTLVYRCIFLVSLYTGFRISSTLSITLQTIDFRNGAVRPTMSKTGKVHTMPLPAFVMNLIKTYVREERAQYLSESDALFITAWGKRKGQPVTYAAYNSALKKAGITAAKLHPDMRSDLLHTHACRSTFLANIRSKQLENQRLGLQSISDNDICILMDWKTLGSLDNYDKLNRASEITPLLFGNWLLQEIHSSIMRDKD